MGEDEVARTIQAYLERADGEENLTLLGHRENVWDVLVPSYWKETIAASLELGEWSLRAEAFFMRAPEDNRAGAFHLFLQRNQRGGAWRFAATQDGDVSLIAYLPRAGVTGEELDRLMGALVTLTDETYVPAMKLGFERGLEEQVDKGGPGLDQPPPWAR